MLRRTFIGRTIGVVVALFTGRNLPKTFGPKETVLAWDAKLPQGHLMNLDGWIPQAPIPAPNPLLDIHYAQIFHGSENIAQIAVETGVRDLPRDTDES